MRTPLFLLLVVLAVLAGACAGSGGDDGEVAAEPTTASTGDDDGSTAATSAAEPTPTETSPKDDAGESLAGVLDEDAEEAGQPSRDEATPVPTEPAEPAGPPTEDLPGGRYVQIDEITAEGSSYAVTFTPYNFEPLIGSGPDDYHVHFFWNTLEPQNAGTNGPAPGEWILYDGGSPFTGWSIASRPPDATAMCALVADSAHGVTVGSGNCVTLP